MNNSELYLRRTEAIDLKHETIKRVAEKLTDHIFAQLKMEQCRCCFQSRDMAFKH